VRTLWRITSVNYPRRSTFRYQCQRKQTSLAERRCFNFAGKDLDAAVERAFLSVLTAPPADMLQRALAESRAAECAHATRIDAELKRLRYEGNSPGTATTSAIPGTACSRVCGRPIQQGDASAHRFRAAPASEPARPPVEGTEDEIRELCEIKRKVPELWRHPSVTHQERKQMSARSTRTPRTSETEFWMASA